VPDLEIKTGDIEKWAAKMEEKGADFAAEVVKSAKRNLEHKRKMRRMKFARVRRKKSGVKRFAIVKPESQADAKELSDHFHDIFKEKK
jgi:hypothetical protein